MKASPKAGNAFTQTRLLVSTGLHVEHRLGLGLLVFWVYGSGLQWFLMKVVFDENLFDEIDHFHPNFDELLIDTPPMW